MDWLSQLSIASHAAKPGRKIHALWCLLIFRGRICFRDLLHCYRESDIQLSEIVPILIILAIFPLYRYVILPNRIKKIYAQQKELHSPFEIEFTDTAMIFSNEFGNATRPWNHFTKWKENNELILLYHSDVIYNTLPKRIFTDPQ